MKKAAHSISTYFVYTVGIVVLVYFLWQFLGFLLPDSKLSEKEELLPHVLERSGGLKRWASIEHISFKKKFTLYEADGSTTIDRIESHNYVYKKDIYRSIRYTQGVDTVVIEQQNDSFQRFVNTARDTISTQKVLKQGVFAGTFVLGLPYTLQDTTAVVKELPLQNFRGTSARVLQVQFANSKDIWTLFYDAINLQWLGYWVKTSDHYSLVINEEMQQVEGFTLSRKRKSYRTDSLMNITWLRAEYEYSDFEINLKGN